MPPHAKSLDLTGASVSDLDVGTKVVCDMTIVPTSTTATRVAICQAAIRLALALMTLSLLRRGVEFLKYQCGQVSDLGTAVEYHTCIQHQIELVVLSDFGDDLPHASDK